MSRPGERILSAGPIVAIATISALAACATAACSAAPEARCPEVKPPSSASPVASATPSATPAAAPEGPRVSIALRPGEGAAQLVVSVTARGEPAALTRWSIEAPDAGAVKLTSLRDDRGPIAARFDEAAHAVVLPAPPAGEVHFEYTVDSHPRPLAIKAGVDLDPNRMEASGEAFLLLPDALDDRPVEATITFDTESLGETYHAATSFGFGNARTTRARGRDLREATYLFGPVGRALFETLEGHDEAAWLGYTSFDPRPIAADVAAFRTAVGNLFGDRAGEELTLLIVADTRPSGAFHVRRRARSVLAHVGVGEPWSAPVRISVATEVIHGWIGGRLWIGPEGPAHEGEAAWFTEGVARHLARDLLFRFGLITSDELLAEVHGLIGALATSPRKNEPNAALGKQPFTPGALPLLVSRGALYATRIDALLRKKTAGKKGLPELLRALYDAAKEKQKALPTSAWTGAIAKELGDAEAANFAAIIDEGKSLDLPDGALGPCFRAEKRRYQAFDLGFDEEATMRSPDRAIAGLRPGGPADKAGVKEGDQITDQVIARGRADVPVELHLARGGEKKTIRYLPAGASGPGQGFSRKKDVPEEACTR
ncbi:MAG: hypothetical protein U0359_05240 [Byssovorax sp.]